MTWRVVSFFLFQVLGILIGGLLETDRSAHWGLFGGLALGAGLWFLIDMSRGVRVLRWLRHGHHGESAVRTGLWGELSDRVRRSHRVLEMKARESDNRLQDFLAALQASPNGVVLLDGETRIEWFNQTAALHFGLDATRDLQQHLVHLVRDPGFSAYLAKRDFTHSVAMAGSASTASRPVRLAVQLHPYGQGRSLLLSNDITALEQAEAMRRDFVANVSHEIRTPLTVLSGFVETLQTLPLDEAERGRYLEMMAQQSGRMQTLVADLLMLSRLEGSAPPGDSEWLPLEALAGQIAREGFALAEVLQGEGTGPVELICEPPPPLAVSGSASELASAMSNLVSNAIRYTGAGGHVRVGYALQDDARLVFSVKDTGPGIAPEHIPRLTERFYRVDRSRSRDTGGTGLGLAIVKHVVQRHGAELRISSVAGVGSTFSIVFSRQRVRPMGQ